MTHLHTTLRLVSVASLATLLAAPLLAQPDSTYVYGGVSVGRSRADLDEGRIAADRLGDAVSVTGFARDRSDTAYKLFGGYQWSRHLGVELGVFDLGRFGFAADTSPAGTLDGSLRVRGLNLDLVGTLPLTERLSALGRVGVIRTRTTGTFEGTGAAVAVDTRLGENDTGYKAGLGLQYELARSVLLRGEVERYRVGDGVGGHGNVNMASLSVVIPFGRSPTPAPRVAAPAYVPPAPAPAPVVVQAPPPPPPPPVVAPAPVVVPPPAPRRVSYSAESLFGFDQATLQPAGRAALDTLVREIEGSKVDVISVEGHTDRLGSAAYNERLSLARAEAVKTYLTGSGRLDGMKITTVGQGETQPVTKPEDCRGTVASAALVTCLQPDRRVEIEIVATR